MFFIIFNTLIPSILGLTIFHQCLTFSLPKPTFHQTVPWTWSAAGKIFCKIFIVREWSLNHVFLVICRYTKSIYYCANKERGWPAPCSFQEDIPCLWLELSSPPLSTSRTKLEQRWSRTSDGDCSSDLADVPPGPGESPRPLYIM